MCLLLCVSVWGFWFEDCDYCYFVVFCMICLCIMCVVRVCGNFCVSCWFGLLGWVLFWGCWLCCVLCCLGWWWRLEWRVVLLMVGWFLVGFVCWSCVVGIRRYWFNVGCWGCVLYGCLLWVFVLSVLFCFWFWLLLEILWNFMRLRCCYWFVFGLFIVFSVGSRDIVVF